MFDSHCHLDFDAFDADRQALWRAARAAGVTQLVVPAYAPAGWGAAFELANRMPGVHAAIGVHPWALSELSDAELEAALSQLPARARQGRAVAVGECGLDGVVARRGGASLQRQRAAFEAQLGHARSLELPVIVHVVRAHGLAREVLGRGGPLPASGVLHSYGGSVEMVRDYAALGLYFSFSPAIARPNRKRARAAAAVVPADRLLVESDGPDPSLPDRHRGEPTDVVRVCEVLAELRGETPAAVERLTADNARALFRL